MCAESATKPSKPAKPPKQPTKREQLVAGLMEKYGLKGRKGRILVNSVIDRVGENATVVETMLLRAILPKRLQHH